MIAVVLGALVALTPCARAGDEPPTIDPEDIVVLWLCASDCNDDYPPTPDNPMCFSYGLERPGRWLVHMQTNILHDYLKGYRRFLLHLPFGSEYGNGSMDLDQPLDSAEAGEVFAIASFFDAIEWADNYLPDAEFIAYLGTNENDLNETLDNDNRFFDHWVRMSGGGYNMKLLDYPNLSIAFDAGTRYTNGTDNDWDAGDPYFQFVKLFESYKRMQGQRVYIEAMPRNELLPNLENPEAYAWQRTMPWIAFEQAYAVQHRRWINHDPPLEADDSIRVMGTQLDRDVWDNRGGPWAWAAECVRQGHSVCIHRSGDLFPWKSMTAAEVAERIQLELDLTSPPSDETTSGGNGAQDDAAAPPDAEEDDQSGQEAQNLGT